MRNLLILITLFVTKASLLYASPVTPLQPSITSCGIPQKINFSRTNDGASFATIDIPSDWELAPALNFESLTNFKNRISSVTSIEPKFLIKRQREFFKDFPQIFERMTQIFENKLGRIDDAGCLETSVLSAILSEYPNDDQVEFSVYILKKSAGVTQEFRAYVITWGLNHVPDSKDLLTRIDQDFKNGWQYYIHLHNHPFFLNNPTGDIAGVIVPSEPDFSSYQQAKGLQNAWVTNGFSTFKLNRSDFNK